MAALFHSAISSKVGGPCCIQSGVLYYSIRMAANMGSQGDTSTQTATARINWLAVLWFGGLLLLCYYPILRRLFSQWMSDPNVGHGLFVPFVASYIAWQKREELLAITATTNWWGLALVIYGSFQLMIGTFGAELFLSRTAYVISIIGVVLLFGGTQAIRILAFPLFLLFFMVPIPSVVFNQITLPLQLIASDMAESALSIMGIPVLREGNILELASQRLSVVEACSGIRSLLSLSFLSLVYSHFFDRKSWMKSVLLVSSIPIAIIANASRVALTGLISEYNPELAEGFFHSVEGWVIFLVSLTMLVITHRIINMAYTLWLNKRRSHEIT